MLDLKGGTIHSARIHKGSRNPLHAAVQNPTPPHANGQQFYGSAEDDWAPFSQPTDKQLTKSAVSHTMAGK